jgi:hypothetical protein
MLSVIFPLPFIPFPKFLHKRDDVLRTYFTRVGNGPQDKVFFNLALVKA